MKLLVSGNYLLFSICTRKKTMQTLWSTTSVLRLGSPNFSINHLFKLIHSKKWTRKLDYHRIKKQQMKFYAYNFLRWLKTSILTGKRVIFKCHYIHLITWADILMTAKTYYLNVLIDVKLWSTWTVFAKAFVFFFHKEFSFESQL